MEGGRIKQQGSPDEIAQENPELYTSWCKMSKFKV